MGCSKGEEAFARRERYREELRQLLPVWQVEQEEQKLENDVNRM